jgi:hypothetical protein
LARSKNVSIIHTSEFSIKIEKNYAGRNSDKYNLSSLVGRKISSSFFLTIGV